MRLRSRWNGALALLVTVALTGAGCADDESDDASATTAAKAPDSEPARLEIVARGLTYDLDRDSVPAGAVEVALVNEDAPTSLPQLATLVKLAEGMTLDDYRAFFEQDAGELTARRATTLFGGPGAVSGGETSTVTVDLEPGTYAVASFMAGADGVFNLSKGQIAELTVVDVDEPAKLGRAEQRLDLRDMNYDLPSDGLQSGAVVEVTNSGPQDHEFGLLKLADRATVDDVIRFFSGPPAGPPPFGGAGGVNGLSPGEVNHLVLPTEPGRYAAFCALGDINGGPPHFLQGMVAEFEIR